MLEGELARWRRSAGIKEVREPTRAELAAMPLPDFIMAMLDHFEHQLVMAATDAEERKARRVIDGLEKILADL